MGTKGLYQTVVNDIGRECTMCGVFKTWENFTKCKSGTRGHHSYCRACRSKRRKRPQVPRFIATEKGRVCSKCGHFKSWDQFDRSSTGSTGYISSCKDCGRKAGGHKKRVDRKIQDDGRECSRCGQFKPWLEFAKNKHGTRGYQSWCRDCSREVRGSEKAKEYLITETGRECSECGEFKPWSEFHKRRDLSTGHSSCCKMCTKKRTRRDMENGSRRNRELMIKYGIDLDEYNRLAESQNDSCAICRKTDKGTARGKIRYWSVDHDHATGKIRGLLCQQCNALLGMAKDDIDILQKAIEYLCNTS